MLFIRPRQHRGIEAVIANQLQGIAKAFRHPGQGAVNRTGRPTLAGTSR
jgi:hypothetical protein